VTVSSTLPPTRRPATLDVKRRQLRVNRRRATGCLIAVTGIFVATLVARAQSGAGWLGYLQATAEAAMVGGLADWFAVTALFRHPLGIPIPHTAIVPERKEQFGATLGEFVQDSFLTPDVLAERIGSARLGARTAGWLSEPANASRLAVALLDAAATASELVEDEAVHQLVEDVVRDRLTDLPLAPLAGRALTAFIEGGRHHELVDSLITGTERFLDQHRDDLHRRATGKAPWWLPGAVEDRIFERMLDGARLLLSEVAANPTHPLRVELDERLATLTVDLQTSPAMRRRGEELATEVLKQQPLRAWVASLWTDAKAALRAHAADPHSAAAARLTEAILAAGARLTADPALAARIDAAAEAGARYAAVHLADEVTDLITSTIARWDAAETTDRLELLLGPDLQYIRINGTVVGGLAGLVLHTIVQLAS
jgi:uncharacterized membrane-anchored protein YjiN (DUF445 family)